MSDPVPSSEAADNHETRYIIGGAHAFMLRVARMFGLAPLRFESHGDGYVISLSAQMCIYSYILVTALVLCTVFGLVSEIMAGMDKSVRMTSRMSQVVSACDVLIVAATALAGVYGAPKRMRNILQLLETVASVDISIGAQYSSISERRVCTILSSILLAFFILLVDDFCFYANQAQKFDRMWDVAGNYIAFYILWLIVVILELQFAFTALAIKARFKAVNDALAHTAKHIAVPIERIRASKQVNIFAIKFNQTDVSRAANVNLLVDSLKTQEQTIIMKRNASGDSHLAMPPCEAIRHIALLYGSLCEIVKKIDDSYGLPVVVILISTLLHLIVTPYFLIMELIVSTDRIHFLVLQFLWCTMHVLRMFVIVEPCHYTINEGKRTSDLVCRLITYAPSTGVLPNRLELFSRQLMMRSLQYSPLGMCILDRPLVASVVGAVTTYLVILIQFQRLDL